MKESDAVLDMATINDLSDLLDEGVYELFDEYIRNAADLLKQLEAAARQGDAGALRMLAHSLKGSSGNLGIVNVYRLCMALEQEAGKGGEVASAGKRVREIADAVNRASEALLALMPQMH